MKRASWSARFLLVGILAAAGSLSAETKTSGPAYPSHENLLEWRDDQNMVHTVKSPEDWKHRRAHILAGMEAVMGKLPDRSQLAPLDVQIVSTFEGPKFTRLKLTFAAEKG